MVVYKLATFRAWFLLESRFKMSRVAFICPKFPVICRITVFISKNNHISYIVNNFFEIHDRSCYIRNCKTWYCDKTSHDNFFRSWIVFTLDVYMIETWAKSVSCTGLNESLHLRDRIEVVQSNQSPANVNANLFRPPISVSALQDND